MKWLDTWLFNRLKNGAKQEEEQRMSSGKSLAGGNIGIGSVMVEKSRPEGENRINFELSSAVGGKILNVRHYNDRTDRHETQTYVIPNGEDIGERVSKIINLEMFKQ
jgi:hypothetical protein